MPSDLILPAAEIPHLSQWLGTWCIQEREFHALVAQVRQLDLHVHLEQHAGPPETKAASGKGFQVVSGGVAVVPLAGVLQKHVASLADGTSTVRARQKIRAAAHDEDVSAILLHVDSPGGTVSGTQDLAADVAAAAKNKPLFAYIEDLGASAAYWVASQANKVYSNDSGLVGSIGTYGVVYDFSEQAEQIGVKVHVLRAGAFKGAGAPGTEITDEQLAEWQRIIDALNEKFLAGVAAGRNLPRERVNTLADGRVHVGQAAEALGLTDGVRSIDEVLDELRKQPAPTTRRRAMSEDTTPQAPAAATLAELKQNFPDAQSDFLLGQLEKNATLADAGRAYQQLQDERIKALETEKAELEEKTKSATAERPGTKRLAAGTGTEDEFDADSNDFCGHVQTLVDAGMDRHAAVAKAAKKHPDAHKAFIAATKGLGKRD